jgi:hypothetical protein
MALDKLTKVQSVGISSFIQVVGVVTATGGFVGDGSGLTGITASSATGDFSIVDKIVHTGDTNTAIRFPAADTVTVETAGTERFRIKSDGAAHFSGNLGLGGQTSPSGTIHINDLSANGYELKVTGNALQFNRSSNSYIDQLHDNGSILFRMTSSNTEAMRITSAGVVRVPDNGKFTAGAGDDLQIYHDGSNSYVKDAGTGELRIESDAGGVRIQRASGHTGILYNVGGQVELYYDNTKRLETLSNGTQTSGRVYLNGTNGGLDYNNTQHTLEYLVNGSTHSELNTGAYVPAGSKNLGANAKRWGTLYLSTGIDFGANSNAAGMTSELLDDYEEGTWSPGLETSSTNGSYTLYQTQGEYIKIGSMVYFRCFVGLSAIAASGSGWLRVSNLPFAGNAGGWGQYAVTVWSNSLTGITAGCAGLVNENNNNIDLWANNTTGSGSRLTPSNLTANAAFYISGTYHVLGY